jgi:hypothetical protein
VRRVSSHFLNFDERHILASYVTILGRADLASYRIRLMSFTPENAGSESAEELPKKSSREVERMNFRETAAL